MISARFNIVIAPLVIVLLILPVILHQPLLAQREGFAHLKIIKRVSDSVNLDNFVNFDFQPSDFTLRIAIDNGTTLEIPGSSSGVVLSIRAGQDYDVEEVERPSNLNNVDFSVTRTVRCSTTDFESSRPLNNLEQAQCIVRNQISNLIDLESDFINENENETDFDSQIIPGLQPQIASNDTQKVVDVESESGTIIEPPKSLAPFKQCKAPSAQSIPEGETTPEDATFVVPSSAKYTIEGKTSVSELMSSVDLDNFLTIKLFNDQQQNDGVTFGTANPRLIGSIAVGSNEIKPVELFRFFVDNVDSVCDFVTAVKPISQQPDRAFSPLANTTDINPSDYNFKLRATIPENHIENQLLVYCVFGNKDKGATTGEISKTCQNESVFNTVVINPPFRTCQNAFDTVGGKTTGSNFDVYVIKGSVGSLSGQSMSNLITDDGSRNLAIQIVADNVITNTDQKKIADSNNPYLTVYFIVDAGQPEAELIPFEINEISTQCTDVGFAADPQVN